MRNEIDYDEFMRLTGGQTIEEEMAADGGGDSMEDEEDESGTADEVQSQPIKDEFTSRAGGDLPVHIRNLMQEIVNDELGACRADALPSALPMETDEPSTSQPAVADFSTERERIPRKLSKTMDALLGHANVIYARGNTKEALAVLLEASSNKMSDKCASFFSSPKSSKTISSANAPISF
ncbi:unnamed protein product [Strongylus vulgaris]|uniref:Uncharacterized protein n=1 Tax=Strongylus vulgaris TaxID=40348 RepID=A0A3P7JFQ2_STRVU|nr:unnamed protein product [Strongylus vulgaris]